MYEKHFGFSEKPFSIIPNPNFLYLSPKHQNALTYLEYGISERIGFVLLTGEIGIGKTTLLRYLLNQIEADLEVAIIFNTNVDSDQLIKLLMQEFEISPVSDDKTENIETIYQFLIKKYAEGRKVLLIIDEAQNLSNEVLEEIRMLSNLHSDNEIFIQIMLVGQPELRIKLNQPELTQLSQRIAANYHLAAMSKPEVAEYIQVRLKKAGCKRDIFFPSAIDKIFEASGGIPRTINLLCDTALVYGYGDSVYRIDTDIIEQVVEDNAGLWGVALHPPELIDSNKSDSSFSSKNISDLESRIDQLEKKNSDLEKDFSQRLDESHQLFTDQNNNALIQKLTDQVHDERQRSEYHLSKYAALKEKYHMFLSNRYSQKDFED